MLDEETIFKEVSIRISKELEKKGHSKHKLETTSWLVNIRESVENRGTQTLFNTGSNAEGTDVTGSDRDAMVLFHYCIAIAEDEKVDLQLESNVFLMVQDGVRPCYTKLRLVQESRHPGRNDLFHRLGGKEKLCVLDEKGRYYFSSEKFTEQLTKHVSSVTHSSAIHAVSSFHVHGPCATFDNTVGKTKFDTDFAYCIPCNNFPTEARAFISRRRQYSWPPENLIGKSLSQCCHIVAVGDKASPTYSVEWRVSFALLERNLVWSLNDTHCKCYIMLKMMLKTYIDELAPDELSSYALKTVIFWCAENDDPSLWTEENLLHCICRCLSKLQSYVTEKNLPHFIVPSNNILATKFEDAEKHIKVVEQLSQMTKWHWGKFLQCPALSDLKLQLDEVGHDVRVFLRCSRHPNISLPFYQDIVTFRGIQSLYMDMNSYLTTTDDLLDMLQSLKMVQVNGRGKEFVKFGINVLLFKMAHIQNKVHEAKTEANEDLNKVGERVTSTLYERTKTEANEDLNKEGERVTSTLYERTKTEANEDLNKEGERVTSTLYERTKPEANEDLNKEGERVTSTLYERAKTEANEDLNKEGERVTSTLYERAKTEANEDLNKVGERVTSTLYERTSAPKHTGDIFPGINHSVERSPLPENFNSLQTNDSTSVESPDICTGNLLSALNFLLCRKYEKAEEMLQKVLAAYQPHVVYIGMCGPEEADLIEYACYTSSSEELSLFDKVRKLLVFDFIVGKRDQVTPFLRQEQLFWDEDAVPVCIHPRVITYYLYFLSTLAQGQEGKALGCLFALSMNVNSMCKNTNIYSYIAWNILGQCYFLMGQYRQAFRAFCNSLKSKPSYNPALYYIGQC